jgi:diguanylate cyclase (GGDEF)-like protein
VINNLKKLVFEVVRDSNDNVLVALRHSLIDVLSVAVAVTAAMFLPATWLRSEYFEWDTTHTGYSVLIIVYIAIALFRRHLPYKIKALSVCLLPFIFSVSGLINYGLTSLGFLAIFSTALLAMMLYDLKWSVISLLGSALIASVISYETVNGGFSYSIDLNEFNQSGVVWGTHIWVFLFMSTVVLVGIGWLQYALSLSIDQLIKKKKELKKATQDLKEISLTDYLTGLPNRRYFYEFAEEAFALHKRYKDPCSVAFLDLDFFKKINDQYGHDGGDTVLKEFSDFVKSHIRESDLFARLGGEEFILLMPKSDSNSAFAFVERLRESLAGHVIEVSDETSIHLGFSAGIASLSENDDSIDALINRADLAVYEAKDAGRNRSVIHY